MRPDVWVVILNFRTPDMSIDVLGSLAEEMRAVPGRRALVVDGGSGDGSADKIAEGIAAHGLADFAELMPLPENRGYAAGNNAAIRKAMETSNGPRYLLILNPDTLARPHAVQALVSFLDDRPEVGLAGSRLEHRDGEPQHSAFRFPNLANEFSEALRIGPVSRLLSKYGMSHGILNEPTRVDWVAGASVMIRREVFETVGLFDEGFFLYFEETDFCHRAAKHGWQCWYVPSSRVVHFVGASTGVTNERVQRARRPKYWFDSRARYLERNCGSARRVAADILFAAGLFGYRMRCKLRGEEDVDPPHLLRDFVKFNFAGPRAGRSQ